MQLGIKTFIGCSEISISVIVKFVQHIRVIWIFCLSGGSEKIAGLRFPEEGSIPTLTLSH